MRRTCIDLFSGCGGLSLGLHQAGWEGLFAIEKDPMAFETLRRNMVDDTSPYPAYHNWPNWLSVEPHDIAALLASADMREHLQALRGTVDLVAGGPPCQGFSVGGRRDGTDDRNLLAYRMLAMVELVRPRLVLVENVEGMARRFASKPGTADHSVAEDVALRLNGLGYDTTIRIVTASDYGVPQYRRRVVILGTQKPLCAGCDLTQKFDTALTEAANSIFADLRLPSHRPPTAREAIDDLWKGTTVDCPDSHGYQSRSYTEAESKYSTLMRKDISVGAIPNSHRFSKHGDRILRLYRLAHDTQPAGRLSKSFLLANDTKKDKKVLLDPDAAVATITTHPDEYIHYAEPRNITVREMARLQSFPDDFLFYGRYTINGPRRRFDVARCSQVGNAVPPLMAKGLGLALLSLARSLEERVQYAEVA